MQGIALTSEELRKLLSCGCADAVPLYLYRKAAYPLETAMDALHFSAQRMSAATDCLRQLGLWDSPKPVIMQPERPTYTETDIRRAMREPGFPKLVGEAQRRLGRTLSTEELKTLLSFTDYLRLPTDVVALLLSYCVERSRRKGVRAPSMRTIDKEAYRWADEGIDNLETACYYVQQQLQVHTRVQQVRQLLHLERRLTAAEEQYIINWLSMSFPDEAIRLAYERTCLQTGALKWAYMNSILKSWHEKNLHTPQEIAQGDTPPGSQPARRGNEMFQRHNDKLSPLEQQAVALALAEGQEG